MKSVCKIYKNETPARFTGNHLRWICKTPDDLTYCETRQCARNVAYSYNQMRQKLERQGLQEQGRIEFYY